MSGETPCILYEGTRNAGGYGVLLNPVHGSRLAHRAALAEKLGRPVRGVSRHTCDNPPCVNPDHLLEGTHADNVEDKVRRGRQRGGRYNQTHCKHGHEMTPENTKTYTRQSTLGPFTARRCKKCRTNQSSRRAAAAKAARHKQKES